MNKSERSRFVAGHLKECIDKNVARFRKANKRRFEELKESKDFQRLYAIMNDAFHDSVSIMDEWETKNIKELGGIAPVEYFESLHTFADILYLITLLEEKNAGALPPGLGARIERLDDSLAEDVLHALDSIQLGSDKCFTYEQMAIVRIAEIIASPQFLSALLSIINQLDNEKSNEETILAVMDAVEALEDVAIESVTDLLEKLEKKGALYSRLVLVMANIASENKSERIYRLLKECFRNSEVKLVEARALAVYGDGRAIPAIRGYVERHIAELTREEYCQFNTDVSELGGDMSDLDEYFMNFEYDDDDDYEYDDDDDDY